MTITKSKKRLARSVYSPGHRAVKRLSRNYAAVAGAVTLLLLALIAGFAPVLAPQGYAAADLMSNHAPPSARFPLGADFLGRDVLSRLIFGTRISLAVALLGALSAFALGLAYGVVAGFYGGRIDNIMMRIVDILYAFPSLLFIILLMITFKTGFGGGVLDHAFFRTVGQIDAQFGGMFLIIVGVSFTSWVPMARLTRGMALASRNSDFIQSAVALGAGDGRIVFRHLVPGLLGPLLVHVTLAVPQFIATEAFLSFIGIGVTPPTPSWGSMIAEGFKGMRSHPHLAIYPGLALAIVMLAFNFLGDGLRDALDPHSR
jgi:ABC-type dipeptide/oligopeptide/nickel transport system permease subunit